MALSFCLGVTFHPLINQHSQHGHEGQLEAEQLMTPQIAFHLEAFKTTTTIRDGLRKNKSFRGFEIVMMMRAGYETQLPSLPGAAESKPKEVESNIQ